LQKAKRSVAKGKIRKCCRGVTVGRWPAVMKIWLFKPFWYVFIP